MRVFVALGALQMHAEERIRRLQSDAAAVERQLVVAIAVEFITREVLEGDDFVPRRVLVELIAEAIVPNIDRRTEAIVGADPLAQLERPHGGVQRVRETGIDQAGALVG